MLASRHVDYLNLALMLVSLGLALIIPFELFLFSYAVLGPLHYATEISWLNERNFFLKKRRHALFLVITCLILSVQTITVTFFGTRPEENLFGALGFDGAHALTVVDFAIVFITGAAFFITLLFDRHDRRLDFYQWLLAVLFVAFLAEVYLPVQYSFFSLMLPTLIHVSVFTALFILSGAMRQKSFSAYAVFAVYTILCIAFFIPHFLPIHTAVTDYARDTYNSSGFQRLNVAVLKALTPGSTGSGGINILNHPFGYHVQAFIAFAYTYHYLNWFSKTSLVGWHRVKRSRLITIFTAWIAIIALYAWDYRIGLAVLFFFSLLHVVLEFPLNHKVIEQIGAALKPRLKRSQAT